MRLGFALPQGGPVASPEAVRSVAQRAEALGYDSVWVLDRLLAPVEPKAKYGGSPDGKLPEYASRVFDPVIELGFVAACTSRVKLGTSIINLPWHNPVLLGRALTSVDVLSGGRLLAGFGAGWSPDEYEAVGVDMAVRFARMRESIDVLTQLWTAEQPQHKGRFFSLPKTVVMKPAQRPRPPIYLAAFQPGAMKLCAEKTDGWMPTTVPVAAVTQMFGAIKNLAQAAGRDPASLQCVYRANVVVTKEPVTGERRAFIGSPAQIREDIQALRQGGVNELFFDIQMVPRTPALPEYLERAEELWALAH
jgi:probable F420-dependent oxidoreductase